MHVGVDVIKQRRMCEYLIMGKMIIITVVGNGTVAGRFLEAKL